MEKERKEMLVLAGFLAICFLFFLNILGRTTYSITDKEVQQIKDYNEQHMTPYKSFAQCLTQVGLVMYGRDTCPYCQAQKELFEGSFDEIVYINCEVEPEKCTNIQGVPTWKTPMGYYPGLRSLEDLSKLSGCPL